MTRLDHEGARVETGVLQLGADWPGVFIRGDDALAYMLALDKALGKLTGLKPHEALEVAPLRGLVQLLGECRVRGREDGDSRLGEDETDR